MSALQTGIHRSALKGILNRKSRITLYVDEIIRESRVCPDCASVRAIHDYRTRELGTLFDRVLVKAARAAYAVPVMPGQRRCPANLFFRWPNSYQTGLARSCSGSMQSLGPVIPFAKPRR